MGMRNSDGTENWHGENAHKDKYSFPDFGQFHLHGHIHSRGIKVNGKKIIDGRQMDVGVPANKYLPVRLAQIESWIARWHNEENNEQS